MFRTRKQARIEDDLVEIRQNALGTRFGIEEIEAVIRTMRNGHASGLTSDGEGARFAR